MDEKQKEYMKKRAKDQKVGENELTVSAAGEYLNIDPEVWDGQTLLDAGHKIVSVRLSGGTTIPDPEPQEIELGEEYGTTGPTGSKTKERPVLVFSRTNIMLSKTTRHFTEPEQFTKLIKRLSACLESKSLPLHVEEMKTHNLELDAVCRWVRKKAGDGTTRMILKLVEVKGMSFSDLNGMYLLNAGDGISETVCYQKAAPPRKETVCLYALEAGLVDEDGKKVKK